MTNATMRKFGYPRTLVGEAGLWSVLVRPKQPTLGSLVLVCREEATAFGALSAQAYADLGLATARIESCLKAFVNYERINYLMLMMVDPDVHFHVIPRYDGARAFHGFSVPDAGWPGPPALNEAADPDEATLDALTADLAARWAA